MPSIGPALPTFAGLQIQSPNSSPKPTATPAKPQISLQPEERSAAKYPAPSREEIFSLARLAESKILNKKTARKKSNPIEENVLATGKKQSEAPGLQPFDSNLWGHLNQYILQDAALHVKTGGHYWNETFGNSGLNEHYEPEKRIQFGLPYVKVPTKDALALQHKDAFPADFEDNGNFLIPIHPSYLDNKNITRFEKFIEKNKLEIVTPDESKFIATPTSSYRTLVVKNKENDNFFQVKVGAPGRVLGANRDLWHEEVDVSVEVAKKIANTPELKGCGIDFMTEDAGIMKRLSDDTDRQDIIPLNCLFRNLPKKNEQLYNFSALISTEHTPNNQNRSDPLIYELANNYIKANKIPDRHDGLKFFLNDLVDRFTKGAAICLKHGITFEPHSQNLGIKVKEGLISEFFIRDGGGFSFIGNGASKISAMPENQKKEIMAERLKKSSDFNKNVVNSMSIFFSFYVMEKLGKVFLKDSIDEDTYGRLGVDHTQLQGKYRVMAKENVLIQSGPNVLNRIHEGHSPLDPRPLERSQITNDNKDLYLSGEEIDRLRNRVRDSYINHIEETIGSLPADARKVLMRFEGAEKGAMDRDNKIIEDVTFPFDQWITEVKKNTSDKPLNFTK